MEEAFYTFTDIYDTKLYFFIVLKHLFSKKNFTWISE